jgi:hypothetical protein
MSSRDELYKEYLAQKSGTAEPSRDEAYQDYLAQKETSTDNISKLDSLLRGSSQGATFGFADELAGAGESTLGSLGLVPDKTYEQARDESRAAYDAAKTANPGSYLAGQVTGGVASSFLPGGAILNAGKGLKGAAMVGAGLGGLSAAGESEAGVTDAALYKDIGSGLAVGGATGGTLSALGSGLNFVANTKSADTFSRIFSNAKSGKGLLSTDAALLLNDKIMGQADDLSSSVIGKLKAAGKELGAAKKEIMPENVRATQESLEALAKDITRTDINAGSMNGVVEKITNMSANLDNMSAKEIENQLARIRKDSLAFSSPSETEELMQIIDGVISKNNPKYSSALDTAKIPYKDAATANKAIGDVSERNFSDDIVDLENTKNRLTQLTKNASKKETNDSANRLASIGKFTGEENSLNNMISDATNLNIAEDASTMLKSANITNPVSFFKPVAYGATDLAGKIVGGVNNFGPLQKATAFVKKVGAESSLGKKVSDMLQMEPTARDRALFTLSQQPWFRTVTKDDENKK